MTKKSEVFIKNFLIKLPIIKTVKTVYKSLRYFKLKSIKLTGAATFSNFI